MLEKLDKQQLDVVKDDSKYLLVSAGAGSGKTFTILGKIYYLLKDENYNPDEILCISFTRKTCESLKEKIKKELDINIPVYTFHKLGLNILGNNYKIAKNDTLDIIIDNYFYNEIAKSKKHLNMICNYFGIKKIEYNDFLEKNSKEYEQLKKLIITFIRLFKSNDHKLYEFNKFIKKK